MIKKVLGVTLSAAMVISLVGCSIGSKISEYEKCKSSYYASSVKLADYSDFTLYNTGEYEVSEDIVEQQIQSVISAFATTNQIKEGKVAKDSVVNIDYTGSIKVKGKDFEFEGGTGTAYDLDIANSQFIPGFAEKLVGKEVGKTVTINVKFPADYANATKDADGKELKLAGKKAKFKVKLNHLSETIQPELTDELIKEKFKKAGMEKIKDLNKYMEDLVRAQQVMQSKGWSDYVEKCEVEVNKDNLNKQIKEYESQFKTQAEQYSVSIEEYLGGYYGVTLDQFKEQIEETFKSYAVMCKIAEKEKLSLDKESYEKQLNKLAVLVGYDDKDAFAKAYDGQYGDKATEDQYPLNFTGNSVVLYMAELTKVKEGDRPTEEVTTVEMPTEAATEAATDNETTAEETTTKK